MFDLIRRILDHWNDMAAIEAMDDRALADLGVSRDQARHLALMPADTEARLRAMAAIFGLEEGDLRRSHAEWIDLTEVCATCGARPACKRMLERAEILDGSVGPGDVGFCPNAASYADIAGRARLTEGG